MNENPTATKWDRRYSTTSDTGSPLEVLLENRHLLPTAGDALDLACGAGASALFLAGRGLHTWAWDMSAVAIEALAGRGGGLPLHAEARDVVARPPEAARFDVICVGHFLDRALCDAISAALRPGGLLFYQTFTRERVDESGPVTPAYRLALNELPALFPDLTVRFYREEGTVGDTSQGFRNKAQLVAQHHVVHDRPGDTRRWG